MNTNTQKPKAPASPWNFNTSPAARLAHYKALADFRNAQMPPALGPDGKGPLKKPDDWQYFRNWIKPAILKTGKHRLTWSENRKSIFVDDLENCPFIYMGDASDHARLDHTGWYADNYQDELIKPAVVAFRRPAIQPGKRNLVYLAATYRTESDGATIDASHYYETARDAARAADSMAEREAEDSREFYAQDAAEQEIEEKRAEIHEINREFLALSAEAKKAKANPYPGPVCAAVREKLAELIANRRKKFERIEKLRDNFWLAVPDMY